VKTEHGIVPDELVLLVDFLNTLDLESGEDELTSRDRAVAWLADHQCGAAPSSARLRAARDVRAGLRASAGGNAKLPVDPSEVAAGNAALARVRLRATLPRPGEPAIVADGDDFDAVLGGVTLAYVTAAVTGRWGRVKTCATEECRFVFWGRLPERLPAVVRHAALRKPPEDAQLPQPPPVPLTPPRPRAAGRRRSGSHRTGPMARPTASATAR
jgi:hypothetical protein